MVKNYTALNKEKTVVNNKHDGLKLIVWRKHLENYSKLLIISIISMPRLVGFNSAIDRASFPYHVFGDLHF